MSAQNEVLVKKIVVANNDGCCANNDIRLDSVHSFLLKIGGTFCIIFGIIELGLGGTTYTYLENIKLGAWWCGILTIIAGCFAAAAYNRGFVVAACVLASISTVITLGGAIADGISAEYYQRLTACASIDAVTLLEFNYGLPEDYDYANDCQKKLSFVPNGCYCVSKGGKECKQLTLSQFATKNQQNCGNILGNYANTLSASTAFCVACLIMVFFISILTCTLLCCPSRSPTVRGRKLDNAEGADVGVTGEGNGGEGYI
jgi:hypothetical protein